MKPARTHSLILLISILTMNSLQAGDTIRVDPGTGTLQSAINQHGGDVIYLLEAGESYFLNGIITADSRVLGGSDKVLTIIGEETDGMPAVIHGGRDGNKPFSSMFACSLDLILKNIFLAGKDTQGDFYEKIISMNADIDIVMDHCVIDPAGTNRTFNGGANANGSCLYLTNSQIYRNGKMDTPNDGGWLGGMSWDTLWVENNTLVSSGQDFIGGAFHREPANSFIWINHNSIFWHDVWIKKSFNDRNFYFTNNLLHDESLFPELPRWYQFFPDAEHGNNLLCQVAIDTLEVGGVKESLPSDRKMFWEYNLMYYSPELKKVPQYAADNDIELAYLLPMLWDETVPLSYTGGVEVGAPDYSCREFGILTDPVSWPHMKYNNNWYDIDPLYNDSMIYSVSDSAGQHILGFYRKVFWEEPGAPEVADLPSYNWDIDGYNGHGLTEGPVIWPRFDGSYTNPELLTASQENLPLGDLNWFPEQKFLWHANREGIRDHVLNLNEGSYQLQDPETISYTVSLIVEDHQGNPLEGAEISFGEDAPVSTGVDGRFQLDTLAGSYSIMVSTHAYEYYQDTIILDFEDYSGTIGLRYAVGISKTEKKSRTVRMYPNPAMDHLTVEGEGLHGASLRIYDLLGKSLISRELNENIMYLDLSGIPEGSYLVQIAYTDGSLSSQLLILK